MVVLETGPWPDRKDHRVAGWWLTWLGTRFASYLLLRKDPKGLEAARVAVGTSMAVSVTTIVAAALLILVVRRIGAGLQTQKARVQATH